MAMKQQNMHFRIKQLLDLKKSQLLNSNPEYQRGIVWSKPQQKRLVDSVLRGYPLPLIYLHRVTHMFENLLSGNTYEIIDGQQRIDTLNLFFNNGFKLFDPIEDEKAAQFPRFIKELPCSWAGRLYRDLEKDDAQRFLDTKVAVVIIDSSNTNEARDLFIRLQAGLPLNAQEKRDAWPGEFTDFVLRLAGKQGLDLYPGHEFFTGTGIKPRKSSRGDNRQLASQMFMLFSAHRNSKEERLCGIDKHGIDQFYYDHLEFDPRCELAVEFEHILDNLCVACGPLKKKLAGHEAIHLMLLVSQLSENEMCEVTAKVPSALEAFRSRVSADRKDRRGDYWVEYGQLTQTGSHAEHVILRRHTFFHKRMKELLNSTL